jgi:hypothetical protein
LAGGSEQRSAVFVIPHVILPRDTSIFSPFLKFNVYPVLESQEGTRIANEAIEFRRSIG